VHSQNHLPRGTFDQGCMRKQSSKARILCRGRLGLILSTGRSDLRSPHSQSYSQAVSVCRDYWEAAYYCFCDQGACLGKKKNFEATCRRRRCFLLHEAWLSHSAYDARMVKIVEVIIVIESAEDDIRSSALANLNEVFRFCKGS
jgi:hypothetical protein